ncbi:MAG: Zn-dependent [Actinobacteria bacterium]|nr:MAG: Zn-dependent [Actinomycetota bacterium]MDO8949607.1 site-2 protease family protein [Actinomycetota bacterium]
MSSLMQGVIGFAVFIPCIVFHEVAHGYVAFLLGDPTAKSRGRLSLNPLKHVDPFGTVLLPLLLTATGMPAFGYAKPVPINPHYFKDYRKGMLLTGLAGPATNLTLAIVAGLVSRGLVAAGLFQTTVGYWATFVLYEFALINLVLMFFNLIPIPPLDGSRVLPIFLSDTALQRYHEFERYGVLIVFGALIILPRVFNIDILGTYLDVTVRPIMTLLTGV